MTAEVPADLQIAPLRRRLLAAMVDAVVGLPALLGLGFAGAALPAIYSRMKRGGSRPRLADGPDADEKAGRRLPSSASSRRWLLAGSLIALPGRNWRGPGARVVGLRRVEARTGGPVTIRSALIRFAVTTAWSELIGQLNRPAGQRLRERGQAIHSEMHDLLDEHAGDPKAQQQAISDRYKARDLITVDACAWPVLSFVGMQLPALFSPLHQTIPDRLAGIVVVTD